MLAAPVPMHIPDGFLSVLVTVIFWIHSVVVIGIALRRTGNDFGDRQVPLMGVLAATIFAAQMLNFTVAGGTSGHLLGAALAMVLVGPWAAVLVMTCVVFVQALIFQDGGLLALGANLFNMAVIGVAVAYMVYRAVQKAARGRGWGILAGGFVAAWASIVASALSVGLQLALSGTSPANVAVPAMAVIHSLIGIGEGLITLGALATIRLARPDLLQVGDARPAGNTGLWIGGLLLALILAAAAPLASTHPDGLQWFAQQQGFAAQAASFTVRVIPHYQFPGIGSKAAATIAAGIVGVCLILAAAFAAARLKRRQAGEQ